MVLIGGTFEDDSGTPQSGAVITVLNDDNDPPTVIGTATTDSGGNWSLDVTAGTTVHCLAEWEDGDGTQYQAESKPFIAAESLPYEDGLVVHFDAAALGETHGYSDGDSVDLWPDESGNGHDATEVNSGENPVYWEDELNGHGAVHFDESSWLKTDPLDSAISQPVTHIVIWSVNTESTEDWTYAFDRVNESDAAHLLIWHDGEQNIRYYGGTYSVFQGDFSLPTDYAVFTGVFDSGTCYRFLNGVDNDLSSVGTNPFTGMTLGGRFNEPRLHGQIAEILTFDHALSDADRQAVENYLLTKWGLPN